MPDFRYFGSDRISNDDHLHTTDAAGKPLYAEITHTGSFISCNCSGERSILQVLYHLPQFGCVVLKTLPLPDVSEAYLLPYELARSKIAQIERCRLKWAGSGFQPSRLLNVEIDAAARMLRRRLTSKSTHRGVAPSPKNRSYALSGLPKRSQSKPQDTVSNEKQPTAPPRK